MKTVAIFWVLALALSGAPILPAGFSSTTITTGLSNAVALAQAPDGRIFISQQAGSMRIVQNNTLLSSNLFSLGVDSSGERGLLGVTLSPTFSTDGFLYAYHTVPAAGSNPAVNRVSRFTVSSSNTTSGQTTIVTLSPLGGATNHNGGAIHFGPDGKLYVATGDAGNTPANSQNLNNLHGKLLRYNADGTIPTDNPLLGSTTGANQAIYQYGLRNPFTFAFHPLTGVPYINDVGQSSFEEINAGAPGANFGWNTTEGFFNAGSFPNFTNPVYAYSRGGGPLQGFAIAGGAFSGNRYYFGDFVNGWVNFLDSNNQVSTFGTGFGNIVDLMPNRTGNGFYVLTRNSLFEVTNDVPEPSTWIAGFGLAALILKAKLAVRRKAHPLSRPLGPSL